MNTATKATQISRADSIFITGAVIFISALVIMLGGVLLTNAFIPAAIAPSAYFASGMIGVAGMFAFMQAIKLS